MASPTVDDLSGAEDRFEKLTEAVKGLRTRVASADNSKVLVNTGPSLIGLGLGLILLGWYGAANTTRVFLQIPYLISGGLLGVGLVIVGAFAFFSRWITELAQQNQKMAADAAAQSAATLAALERIEELLATQQSASPRRARDGGRSRAASPTGSLVTTAKGKLVHRADCRLVEGRATTVVSADSDLDPCLICEPELA